jgi:hypothetical protein
VNLLGTTVSKQHLHKGRNFVVIELENAIGPCALGIDVAVNGVQLSALPQSIPEGFQVEKEAVNPSLFRKLQASLTNSDFSPDPLDDIV